jgi:hypothetical protein
MFRLDPLAGDTSEGDDGDVTSTLNILEADQTLVFPALSLALARQYHTPSASVGIV